MRRGPQHGGGGGGEQADRVGTWVASSPPLASSPGARHCVRCTLAACILQEPGGWGCPGLVGGPMGIRIREVRQAKPTGPDIRELTAGFASPNFSFHPITLKPSLKAAGAALWDISHGLFDRFSKTGGTSPLELGATLVPSANGNAGAARARQVPPGVCGPNRSQLRQLRLPAGLMGPVARNS